MTLQWFCKKIIKGEKLEVGYKAPGSIFTLEQENLLNHYVVHASKIYFGLSPQLFRKLAYEFAVANNIKHPTSWNVNKSAGLLLLSKEIKTYLFENQKQPAFLEQLALIESMSTSFLITWGVF